MHVVTWSYIGLGLTEAAACGAVVPGWILPMNAHMALAAVFTLVIGCHGSLEQEAAEVMDNQQASTFPLVAGAGLLALFLAFKSFNPTTVNLVLKAYFALVGTYAVGDAVKSLLPRSWVEGGTRRVLVEARVPVVGPVVITALDVVCWLVGGGAALAYWRHNHWLLNNALAISFCLSGLKSINIGQYSTGAFLLLGLFVYDIVMVFGTPMMVAVATQVDGPIKLLLPRGFLDATGKPAMALLGLGDIVFPGIFLAFLLRFDSWRYFSALAARAKDEGGTATGDAAAGVAGTSKRGGATGAVCVADVVDGDYPKPLFWITLAAYVVGLGVTIAVMLVFDAAQPALLYLVPAVLVASLLSAAALGRAHAVFAYNDAHYMALFEGAALPSQ